MLVFAVLVRYESGPQPYELTLAGRATSEQSIKMAELAEEAFRTWKLEGHPGWCVDSLESHQLQQLDQHQVEAPKLSQK